MLLDLLAFGAIGAGFVAVAVLVAYIVLCFLCRRVGK